MSTFQGLDFYNLDGLLDEEERMVRDTMREFVSDKVIPIIEKHNREATFPAHLVPQLAELGVLGANIKGYGCAGMNNVAYGLIMQELERGDSGLRSFASVQGSLVMYPIHAFGSEEQKDRWLPELAAGRSDRMLRADRAGFRLEPGRHATRAVQGRQRLDPERRPSAGSPTAASRMWPSCGPRRKKGSAVFLLRKERPAYTHRRLKGKFSLRASVTSELIFEDCRIPAKQSAARSKGPGAPLSCLNQARYGIAWGALGAAMACYDEALDLLQDAHPVRQADRVLPDDPGETGEHAYRNHKRTAPVPATRPAEGPGQVTARSRCRSPR